MFINLLRATLISSFALLSLSPVSASNWKSILEQMEKAAAESLRERAQSAQSIPRPVPFEDDITIGNAGVPFVDPEDTHNDESIAQMVAEEELEKLRRQTRGNPSPQPQPQPQPTPKFEPVKKLDDTLNDEVIAQMMAEEAGTHQSSKEDLDAYKTLNLTEEEQMQLLTAQFGVKVEVNNPEPVERFNFPMPQIRWTPEDRGVINRMSQFFAGQAEVDVHGVNKQIPVADQQRMFAYAQALVREQAPVTLQMIIDQATAQFEEIKILSQRKLANGQPVMSGATIPNFEATLAHINAYFAQPKAEVQEIQLTSQDLLFTSYRLAILVDKLLNRHYGENVNRLVAKGLFENEMTGGGCYQGYMGRIFKDMCQNLQDVSMLIGPVKN